MFAAQSVNEKNEKWVSGCEGVFTEHGGFILSQHTELRIDTCTHGYMYCITYPRYQQLRQFFLAHSPPILMGAKRFSRTILHDSLLSQHFDVVRGLVGHELPLTSTITVVQAQESEISAQKDENGGPVRATHDDGGMVACCLLLVACRCCECRTRVLYYASQKQMFSADCYNVLQQKWMCFVKREHFFAFAPNL
jgi:hypothetical protein